MSIKRVLFKEPLTIGTQSSTTQFLTDDAWTLEWSADGQFLLATEARPDGLTYEIAKERVAWTARPKVALEKKK